MSGSSAFMAIAHIFLCYFLFLSFNNPFGHGATVVEKNNSHAMPSHCLGPRKGLRVVHKYGPCSPFGLKKSTTVSSQILAQDDRRVRLIYSGVYNRRAGVHGRAGDHDFLKDSLGASNYVVQVGFGTPVQTFHLIIDTGSYKTWVQCQPPTMFSCPTQRNQSLYYPSCSSTYSNTTCSAPPCNENDGEKYKDKSEVAGTYMVDTLHIEDEYEIPKFVFLCADHVEGNFDDANGILGLGLGSTGYGGNYALTSQTAAMFHKVFCYCLPQLEDSNGYVYFGDKARENCPFSGSYTPLLRGTLDPSFYHVNLIAITIGQKRVDIGTASGVSSPRTILDSGTVITRLPSSVYSVLRS
ncbi:aspartyl protease AED1-like [Hibiscus syriacus]|uniref:aspartyl protease AED1-like n=1 Tax=Hibiscus syriacus TaxID=106335 RepID=UPI001922B89D|nr:aspartyl protease AED1-like [Hibiscus syriacus]